MSPCLILQNQGLSLCLAIDCQVATLSEPPIYAGVADAHVMSGYLCGYWELKRRFSCVWWQVLCPMMSSISPAFKTLFGKLNTSGLPRVKRNVFAPSSLLSVCAVVFTTQASEPIGANS